MSRKRKYPRVPATPAAVHRPALPDDADAAPGKSRHREAIEYYKAQLKRERRPEWVEGLAAAYAGRAEQLAAKGMLKEALALWRTRADACGLPVLDGPYLGWLARAGETGVALRLLADAAATLAPEARSQLETQLAAAALTAQGGAFAELAADSPLLRHRAAAQAALAAFSRGDDSAMTDEVQGIPFRSPYRDLRAILKALAVHATDVEQAAAILARVPADGPFEPLAKVARVCVLPGHAWVVALRDLSEAGRSAVLDLKGCPEEQRALLLELSKLGEGPGRAEALFDLVARYDRVLPDGAAARLCRRLLPHVPRRLAKYAPRWGALAPAEEERILALAAELGQRTDDAEQYWLGFVERVGSGAADRRRAALVLRHLCDSPAHRSPDGSPCEHALAWWGRSLELDPEDRATHVRLIRALRERSDLKGARARLDAALARFPRDTEILLEAVETALASSAFKKAAGLAKRVLEFDPINPRVRAVVGQAHVSHARKHIARNNRAGADHELTEAQQWLRTTADLGSIKLLRGLIHERVDEGDALLREGIAALGGHLVGGFALLLEASRTRRDARELLRRAGVDPTRVPAAGEVVAFAHALNAVRDEDALRAALGPLREALRRAAAVPLTDTDQLLVCEALHRRHERDLTRRYAEAALQRWPGRPVFIYLRAAAAYGASTWRIPANERKAIERALEVAKAQGDERTVLRLRELLPAAPIKRVMPDDDILDDLERVAEEGIDRETMLEMMRSLGGEDRFLDLARRQLGRDVFEDLRRTLGGNKKEFANALMDMIASIAITETLGPPGANASAPPRGKQRPPPPEQKDLFDE